MIKNKYIIVLIIAITLMLSLFFVWNDYKKQLSASLLHNLGNSKYDEFVEQGAREISFLQEAQDYYLGSLDIISHPDTQYNYDYVSELLEQYKNKQEQQKENEEQEGEEEKSQDAGGKDSEKNTGKNGESGETEDSQGNEQEQESDNGQVQKLERGSEYFLDRQEEISEMTSEEQKMMEKYIENLKGEEKFYQRSYNKKGQNSSFQNIFNDFFGEVDRGGEKDW